MWEIIKLMHQNKVNFCLQHRGIEGFYNFAVTDTKGKQHFINTKDIKIIEETIKIMYGHLKPVVTLPLPKL